MKSLSRVQVFATPWNVSYQAPLSMGFSRQEYWNGLPFPSPGDLPNPGIEPWSPALQAGALRLVVQFSQHYLLKRLSLSHGIFLPPSSKNKVPMGAWVYFWPFYIVPLVYISVFMPVPCCLDDSIFVV